MSFTSSSFCLISATAAKAFLNPLSLYPFPSLWFSKHSPAHSCAEKNPAAPTTQPTWGWSSLNSSESSGKQLFTLPKRNRSLFTGIPLSIYEKKILDQLASNVSSCTLLFWAPPHGNQGNRGWALEKKPFLLLFLCRRRRFFTCCFCWLVEGY